MDLTQTINHGDMDLLYYFCLVIFTKKLVLILFLCGVVPEF